MSLMGVQLPRKCQECHDPCGAMFCDDICRIFYEVNVIGVRIYRTAPGRCRVERRRFPTPCCE
jgi:hypothetical protein